MLPDYLHDFFGDKMCNGQLMNVETGKMEYYFHYGDKHKDMVYHWGYRHWLWLLMGLSLFAVQAARIIKIINDEYGK